MDVSSHTVLFPAGEDVPKWVHLIPAGTFSGDDGRGPYHLRDAQAVITASMAAGKLPVDESHSTMRAASLGNPAPARGWIVEMQARADGIWGRVEWTDTGTAIMADRAYKGISPVFDYGKDGTVVRIRNAALTNNPNLTQLTSLHTNGNDMDKSAICTALGIAGTVDDAAVMAALQAAATAGTALQTAQAELDALKRTYVPLDTVTALQAKLDTLEMDGKKARAVAFVDAAIKAGKPIMAVRANFIALHTANPAEAELMVNAMPSINAGGAGNKRVTLQDNDGDDTVEMTASDMAVCAATGTDPKAFAKTKKKLAAASDGRAA